MNKTFTLPVLEDEDGESYIVLPQETYDELGWEEGNTLNWHDNEDGSFTLSKKEADTEWVLVEAVSTMRMRYMVEVPKGKAAWALDTVSMDEAKEFSQEYLGEQIVSSRVVTKDEALMLHAEDNAYCYTWAPSKIVDTFFTTLADQE